MLARCIEQGRGFDAHSYTCLPFHWVLRPAFSRGSTFCKIYRGFFLQQQS